MSVASTCKTITCNIVAPLVHLLLISLTVKQLINYPLCYLPDQTNIPEVYLGHSAK